MPRRLRSRRLLSAVCGVLAAAGSVLAAACGGDDDGPPPPLHVGAAASWPAADDLFHRGDPAWLGADGAYSVDLGDGRILWLFGDTFVATSAAHVRGASEMVRNTVAIQDSLDPLSASFTPAWRTDTDATPASFFAEAGDRWHWPGHGFRVPGGPLVVFLSVLRATPGEGLGFAGDGWRVAIVDDPSGPAAAWTVRTVEPPPSSVTAVVGAAVADDGDQVVALAVAEAGDHATFLARWPRTALASGDLTALEWWQDGAWVADSALAGPPTALFTSGATEASLHHDAALDLWIYVYSRGFGGTTIAVRTAPALTGPWSGPLDVFTPPESRGVDPFVYAAKAHPEQSTADGALAITYATNSFTFADLFTPDGQRDLYWPRFVTVALAR